MNKFDLSVLKLLQNNAKLTAKEIAVVLDSNEEKVKTSIRQMEDSGVIAKYCAVINTDAVEELGVLALVELDVNPIAANGYDSVANAIARYPEVKSVCLMSGTYDLSVQVECKNLKDVSCFVNEKLATIPQVTKTATHFIMKQYKTMGVRFTSDPDERNLVS